MVNNVIHATYTEMYDLNTINGELSMLAIHTPQSGSLKRMFRGFYEQYKKMKVLGCNFKLQCPTKQELTPLDVGVATAGKIDPRAIMDPILFKACTGEGMNTLLDQIYNAGETLGNYGSVDQHRTTDSYQIAAYRSLLADGSFRQAHPQVGMTVMGLKPMVHKVVTTQPFKWSSALRPSGIENPHITGVTTPGGADGHVYGFGGQSGSKTDTTDPVNPTVFVSNGLTDMPWLDTAFSKVHDYSNDGGTTTVGTAKAYTLQTSIPRVYMGCIVLPPSPPDSGVNLYYRLTMVWHILFKDFRPAQDLMPIVAKGNFDESEDEQITAQDLSNSGYTYFDLYHTSSKLTNDYGSVDTTGVESIEKTLEKVD